MGGDSDGKEKYVLDIELAAEGSRSVHYDGAGVNGRKENFCCFWKTVGKKYIFYAVFEKIMEFFFCRFPKKYRIFFCRSHLPYRSSLITHTHTHCRADYLSIYARA